MLRGISLAGLWGVATAAAFQTPDPQSATFHAGTRLVQVEVVVRGNGPVRGLTKDDFTVLDQGKRQRIDVFHAGPAITESPATPLPPGSVSNRVDSQGKALPNATVVLFDQLNTGLDLKAYENEGVLKLVRGLRPGDRVAIYALGKNLHVLQDFTDDPRKLLAALSHLDSGRDPMPANIADALFDFPTDMTGRIDPPAMIPFHWVETILNTAETNAQVNATSKDRITAEALMHIVPHLKGLSGRRNLIWIKEDPAASPCDGHAAAGQYRALSGSDSLGSFYGSRFHAKADGNRRHNGDSS